MSWHVLHDRFDPALPIADAAHAAWRADRPSSPAKRIVQTLDVLEGVSGARWLLMGTVGTGKTTELFRVAEARATKEMVVVLDLATHFDRVVGDPEGLQRVEPWEVLLLASLALLRAAEDQLSERFDVERKALEVAWASASGASGGTTAKPVVDVAKLLGSLAISVSTVAGVPGASALTPLAAISGWTMPVGVTRTKKLLDQDDDTRSILSAFNRIAGGIQHRSRRVLLVIDGLDRITRLEHANRMFVESSLFAKMQTALVVTAPVGFRHSLAPLGIDHGLEPITLENAPVLAREAPERPGPGIAFLEDLYDRRLTDRPASSALLPRDEVQRLAYYSGGRAREFVRLVRQVALEALVGGASVADSALVDRVLRLRRLQIEQGLDRGHIDVLRAVKNDPQHVCPEGSERVWELLRAELLLPYPDGSPWYYPQPLLLLGSLLS